jgi:hypothetical protein
VIYAEERFCTRGGKNSPVTLQDLKHTQSMVISNLKEAYDALMTVCYCNQDQVSKWKFLTTWASLTTQAKLEKWEEFGGDELNVFIFMKDRTFFDENIKPILSYKSEFTLTDRLLIGQKETLSHLVHLSMVSNLSPVHLALLLIQTEDTTLHSQVKTMIEGITSQIQTKDYLVKFYDSILASKAELAEPEIPADENFRDHIASEQE